MIVIGCGMAGSIVAARCAEAGLKTLVLEKGSTPIARPDQRGFWEKLRGSPPDTGGERWDTPVSMRTRDDGPARDVPAVLGLGQGGSGRIYGAALGRANRADFERDFQPSQWGAESSSAALPNDWPVDFDSFVPAYRAAEELLGPVGTRDPLDRDDDAHLAEPPPISAAHRALMDRLTHNGRHPFRMHTGIAYKPGCNECQGTTCLRDCKAHGFNRALVPAIERQAPVTIADGVEITAIKRGIDGEWLVEYSDKDQSPVTASAPTVVLAAGALNTPRLLQASADLWDGALPEMIGRGLMFHASEIFAVAPPDGAELSGPRKTIAFRDHYMDGAMPLAECQSLGMVAKSGMIASFLEERIKGAGLSLGVAGRILSRPVAEVAQSLFAKTELFTAALQDLPYRDNRVFTESDAEGRERIAITYRPRAEMLARAARFRELVTEAFAPLKVRFLNAPGEPNLGHPMGTCRMGGDPATSVADANGQVWDQAGLFIADASAFPSSLGINPALTVAAHAIRVSDHIVAHHAAGDRPMIGKARTPAGRACN